MSIRAPSIATREALRAEIGTDLDDGPARICGRRPKARRPIGPIRQAPGGDRCAMPCSMRSPAAIRQLGAKLAMAQLATPASMTDEIGALSTPRHCSTARSARKRSTPSTQRHSDDHLLVDKWFALQASAPLAQATTGGCAS